ncbi:hypothetical protein PUN4_180140 [Paraburkholderia unamae]|nr:hypothetical protein PUN4_180140 [Paraburkholderia unamae]
MPYVPPYEIAPAVLVTGSLKEAARFLLCTLCHEHEYPVPVPYVLCWVTLLQARGADFASHVVTCECWLQEHHRGYRPRPQGGH